MFETAVHAIRDVNWHAVHKGKVKRQVVFVGPTIALTAKVLDGARLAKKAIDQAKSLLQQAGQSGLQVQLFTGDDIGSVAPASRRAAAS